MSEENQNINHPRYPVAPEPLRCNGSAHRNKGSKPIAHWLVATTTLVAVALLLIVWPHRTGAVEIPESQDPVLQVLEAPPDVPIVFVSRNRLATLDNIYVGPPVNMLGRELTPGGRLKIWRPDGSVIDLTDGTPLYDVQEPDVSFDATKVVFSAVTEEGGQWYLWEMGLDGSGLRQLTFDDRDFEIPVDPSAPRRNERIFGSYGDFGPAYLPDGQIIFVSTRYATLSASCGHRGLNLYVLDPDSGEMLRRTTQRAGAIDPAVLQNGKIVFSHWADVMSEPALDGPGLRPLEADYNFAESFWGIWAVNPDGSSSGRYAFARGGIQDSGGLHQPRELPDGDLVATYRGSGSLLRHTLTSAITRITPGPTEPCDLRFLGDPHNLEAPHAMGPAPLPDGRVVCSYTPSADVSIDSRGRRTADYDFGLYVVDEALEAPTSFYNQPDTDELDAVVVYPRSALILQDGPDSDLISDDPTVDFGLTGKLINTNVYADTPLDGVFLPSPKVGTVTQLEVYDDSQTFTTSEEFPKVSNQMPQLIGIFPVDEHGAFTATVPADRALLYVLTNGNGVASRTAASLESEDRPSPSITHTFGHDFKRPGGGEGFTCAGCHRGHMFRPELAIEAKANLSRLATASASSEVQQFSGGAWRVNDLRRADKQARFAWSTRSGAGEWVQLDWPTEVEITRAVLYPLTERRCRVTDGTLSLSDGTSVPVTFTEDDSPIVVPFEPPRYISWMRFTVDEADSRFVGLSELVVNGPANVDLPDTPPPAPTNLTISEGVLSLAWDPVTDPGLAGYKLYYGPAPGQYTESADVGDVLTFNMMRDRVTDGMTYYVAAKAYNVHSTESEDYSNEVSATALAPVILSVDPDHGPIGGYTPITIKGRNFAASGVYVRMDGRYALTVDVVDEQTIIAQSHWNREGPVDIKVCNPDDQCAILEDGFTYVKPE